jgi:hypothetical protein
MGQNLNVDYTANVILCQICNKFSESNGDIVTTNNCKHAFHISCLINHASTASTYCPCCREPYYDIRILLAVAYKKRDTQLFLNVLQDPES